MAGRIKGAVFREYVGWLARDLGQPELEKIAAHVGGEARRVFVPGKPHLGILAASWYETSAVHGFLDALAQDRSDAEIARLVTEGARGALEVTLTGVHRAILRVVASPDLHARFAQHLWNTYYEDGVVISEREGPSSQRIAYRQWRSHHPLLCRITTASDLVVFPLMGLPDVRVTQLSCIQDGDGDCTHRVEWAS
jgi:hypothetical protein